MAIEPTTTGLERDFANEKTKLRFDDATFKDADPRATVVVIR